MTRELDEERCIVNVRTYGEDIIEPAEVEIPETVIVTVSYLENGIEESSSETVFRLVGNKLQEISRTDIPQ